MKKLSEYTSKDGKFVHQAKAGRYGGSKPDVQKPLRAPKNKDLDKLKDNEKKPELADESYGAQYRNPGLEKLAAKKRQEKEMAAKQKKEGVDEKLVGNQHKIDANKDGKITSHDFKKLRKQKGETAIMDPKLNMEVVKSADKEPEAYTDPRTGKIKYRMVAKDRDMIKQESTIRQKLLSIFEKKDPHTKGAVSDPMGSNIKGAGAQKMVDDNKDDGRYKDLEKQSHDDASKAGRVGPNAKARPNDNKQGDKKIINPVDDVTKKAGGSAEVKEESIMDKVIAYLRK